MADFGTSKVTIPLRYLTSSISNLSKFLAYDATEDISIERVKLCTKPDTKYGVDTLRLDLLAYNAEGSKLELFISGLDKKIKNKQGVLVPAMYYGFYIKSKDASDFATYGVRGDTLYLLPLLDKVLHWVGKYQEVMEEQKPISSIEWSTVPAINHDFREIETVPDKGGEVSLLFHRSWRDNDVL